MKRDEIRARFKDYTPLKEDITLPSGIEITLVEGTGADINWAQTTIQELKKQRLTSPIEQAALSAVRLMQDEDGQRIFRDDEIEEFLSIFSTDLTYITKAVENISFSSRLTELAKN